jgi:glycosyltransferase involved in cell wall biosynthesis
LQPDLVSTHSSKAGWIGRAAARLVRIPVLFTAHGWAFTEGVPSVQRRFYAAAERLAAPLANHIITVSNYDRQLALDRRLTRPDRITCIHNGVVDLPVSVDVERHQGPVRIAMIGRLTPQKDHASLFQALGEYMGLDWVLDLVGDGPGLAEAKRLASAAGIADRVHFLGARDDVAEVLGNADIYALVSHWEGLPRSILEAMRAELPVVASDVGGVAEAVVPGETGFLVPRGDAGALGTRLEILIRDRGLRKQFGVAGRRSYEENFRFELMCERTFSVYEQVVDRA